MFPMIAVLEKCLLGCADTFVSVYSERSPQNISAAGRLVMYRKVCASLGEEPSELW